MNQPFTTRPELSGGFGMVASTHWLASAAGMAELEAGGNACDAAAAAGFVLQVVEPHLNGPLGDMTLLFALADADPRVLCGQGPAPAAAAVEEMRARGLDRVPGSGVAAAAVPGSTIAWLTLLRDHGSRPLAEVLKYAIFYARNGFPVLPSIERTIATVRELFAEHWVTSAAQYLPGGLPAAAGSQLTNPAEAELYERLVASGGSGQRERDIEAAISAWSTGFVAEAVEQFAAREHADGLGNRYAGLLTGQDLADFTARYEPAVATDFHGWTVSKAGPWSQGPVLLQQLRLLDAYDLSAIPPSSAQWVHAITEAAKLAFADRDAYYGDPAFTDVPLARLLSADYAAQRRGLITEGSSAELRPGSVDGRTPKLPSWQPIDQQVSSGAMGEPTVRRSGETRGDTCHVSVVDRFGTMVAATPSGGWLQSSPLIEELGAPLGTRLQMTTLEPNLPTTLRPGARPRTTLTPSIAVHGDGRRLAFGTPGGDQQDQWQLGFLMHHLVGGANLQQAIDAPAHHSEHFPSSFYPRASFPRRLVVENRLGDSVIDDLRARGHEVVLAGDWALGRMSAVSASADGKVLRAAANPRGMQGYATGR